MGRQGAREPLVNGLFYTVLSLDPLERQEDIVRFGAEERRKVCPSLAALPKQITLIHALTAASVQGDTVESSICITGLNNPHMCTKSTLEMAVGRARTAALLCFR